MTQDSATKKPEPVETKEAPGLSARDATTQSPQPLNDRTVVTNPLQPAIGSDTQTPFLLSDRALSQSIDDVERDFGLDIYSKLLNDATIAGAMWYLKTQVLSEGLALLPAFTEKDVEKGTCTAEEAKQAAEICEYVFAQLEALEFSDQPFVDTLFDMLDCMAYGHRLADVTFKINTSGKYKGRTGIESVVPKPRKNYAFVVDSYNKLIGIHAVIPGVSPYIRQGIIWDPATLPNMLAPQKTFTLRITGGGRDPRGKSLLRPVYDPWNRKRAAKPEYLRTVVQFAGGMIWAVMGENTPAQDPVTKENTMEQTANAMAKARNGSAIVLQKGIELTVDRPNADGSFFDQYFKTCDREMVTALIVNARSMMEAEHGSKADSGQGQDVFNEIRKWLRGLVCRAIRSGLLRNLVALDLGEDIAESMTPIPTMQATTQADSPEVLTSLSSIGYRLHRSQFKEIDTRNGFGEREKGWEEDDAAAEQQPAGQKETKQKTKSKDNEDED